MMTAAAALLLAPTLASAQGYSVATSASTYTGFSYGCTASYNDNGTGALFKINNAWSCGSSPYIQDPSSDFSGGSYATISYRGSTDTTGTAKSAFDTTTETITASGDKSYLNGVSATATAAASLAEGALHVYASGTDILRHDGVNGGESATASASLSDTLHFAIPDATPETVTYLKVTFKLDGAADGFFASGGYSPAADLQFKLDFGSASYTTNGGYNDASASPTSPVFGYGEGHDPIATGWVSFTADTSDATDTTFTGVYAVTGADPTVAISLYTYATVSQATLDFSDTAQLGLILPDGVSYTSDSGVFLTAGSGAAPEAPTWAMLLAGFAALGLAGRRVARKSATQA